MLQACLNGGLRKTAHFAVPVLPTNWLEMPLQYVRPARTNCTSIRERLRAWRPLIRRRLRMPSWRYARLYRVCRLALGPAPGFNRADGYQELTAVPRSPF
jgi:hypothetical protein